MMQQNSEATNIEVVVITVGTIEELVKTMSRYVLFIESFRHTYPSVNTVAKN